MSLLPFGSPTPYKPRRFVPAHAEVGNWDNLAPLFDRLESNAAGCATVADLEAWLLEVGELYAAVDQESSCRYIAMTCHTESPEDEKAYLEFVETIEPQLKPRQFALAKIFLRHPLQIGRAHV